MEKYYIAKSNKANPDDVMRVRQLLSKYQIEVFEFTGGKYSHDILLKCGTLIVVPDLSDYESGDTFVSIGKGLYEQIEAFNDPASVMVVLNTDNGISTAPMINYDGDDDIEGLEVVDSRDYINYGVINIDVIDDATLTEFMDECFELKEVNSTISNSESDYRYLVIKK